jgi:hypothetical protein
MAALCVYRQISRKCKCCVPKFKKKIIFKYKESNNNAVHIYSHHNGRNYVFVEGYERKRLLKYLVPQSRSLLGKTVLGQPAKEFFAFLILLPGYKRPPIAHIPSQTRPGFIL